MRLRIIAANGHSSERAVTAAVVLFGRDPTCEVHFDPDAYPMVSGRHAKIERTSKGAVLTPLSQSNKTILNDKAIEGPVAVKAGDRIRLAFTGPTVEIVAIEPPVKAPIPAAKPAAAAHRGATVQAAPQDLALLRGSATVERMDIGRGGIIGRVPGQTEFLLQHAQVSRRHARITVDGDRVLLHDLGSANGTFVNGRRLARQVELNLGDRIDIGPFSLEFDGDALASRTRSNNIEVVAHNLSRVVKDRTTGRPLTLLDNVSLVVRPGEFVCLLGPSGSGKSTLLAIVSGRNPPDEGTVRVNGQDLYENFAALKQDIAVVPQKDLLHNSLAVGTALGFTAELRLPPDTGRAEIASSVTDILAVVGLTQRRGTLLRHLSGGQVKRASLANELMAGPSLLFLDEVTSGLDEQTDREMMDLFRQVADGGKTVVCITHSLANVEATCHLVAILTEGGRLAFFGTPEQARQYFGIARLGDVYRKLAARPAPAWQADFRASPFYARYVRDRLPGPPSAASMVGASRRAAERTPINPLRQGSILTRRYAAIWGGDPTALLTMLGQALLVAFLLGVLFGRLGAVPNPVERAQRTVNLLFLLNVSCFWFGCNNAAKELVKERLIYARERDFNLRIDSYLASKLAVLGLIGLVQVTLLFGIVRLWCDPPGSVIGQWLVLAALAFAGTGLGLLISAFANTEEVALALLPVVVMPQIVLAGVIAPLSGAAEWFAKAFITAHWGQQALQSLLPNEDLAALQLRDSVYGVHFVTVGIHFVVFATLTFVGFWWQERAAPRG